MQKIDRGSRKGKLLLSLFKICSLFYKRFSFALSSKLSRKIDVDMNDGFGLRIKNFGSLPGHGPWVYESKLFFTITMG
jgi:hypothetical protein